MKRFLFYVKENYEQYCAKVVVMEFLGRKLVEVSKYRFSHQAIIRER